MMKSHRPHMVTDRVKRSRSRDTIKSSEEGKNFNHKSRNSRSISPRRNMTKGGVLLPLMKNSQAQSRYSCEPPQFSLDM
jgi:hypothetical protein